MLILPIMSVKALRMSILVTRTRWSPALAMAIVPF